MGWINEIQNITLVVGQDTLLYQTLMIAIDIARISLIKDTIILSMMIQI